GYPANINGLLAYGQYTHNGAETSRSSALRSSSVREFAIDSTGGNSGGPFLSFDEETGQARLVGISSYGSGINDLAGGAWYSLSNRALVSDWISWSPNAASAGSVDGRRLAAVFSSADTAAQSFLRFYNSGENAGTVEVTLSDYISGNVLGTWTSPSIPAGAQHQHSIKDIEDGANQAFARPALYSVSVRSTFAGRFQHVLWR
ncbi:MAG: hypothetical protein RLN70_08640, partial [Rhodospirillaceae bacterium]